MSDNPYFACVHCNYITQVPKEYLGRSPDCPKCSKSGKVYTDRPTLEGLGNNASNSERIRAMEKRANPSDLEYDVVNIREGFWLWFLFGASSISTNQLRSTLNDRSSQGWELEFQVLETRAFLGFLRREGLVLTFSRKKQKSKS